MLAELQSRLLDVGSNIATPPAESSEARLRRVAFSDSVVEQVEAWIDELDDPLPELKNFILPGGSRSSATLHVARTVARRLERCLWDMEEHDSDSVDGAVLRFANRLSDWLFVAARHVAHVEGAPEVVYKKD